MKTARLNFENQNIGLYGIATDEYCLVGNNLREEHIEKIKDLL